MKFFNNNLTFKNFFYRKKTFKTQIGSAQTNISITILNKNALKCGFFIKNKFVFGNVFSKINYFFYFKKDFLYKNYSNMSWLFDDVFEKNLNTLVLFKPLIDLIKPPFTIKSILIPKKIKKKTKLKYAIKIVYKNESKRESASIKQIYYNNNKFNDGKFNVRMYKSIFTTLLEWKESNLFKLKTMVFKKFFKF